MTTVRTFMLNKITDLTHFAKTTSLINGPYITTPELDVKYLLAHLLKCETTHLSAYYHETMPLALAAEFDTYLQRRQAGEPVSKIIGYKAFWNDSFKVSQDTLDPRPDSETLIEALLELLPHHDRSYKILDLGTGTGCLLLTLVSELQNASGIGADISLKALDIARENASALCLNTRVNFIQSNWFENITDKFDIIISNPPYIVQQDIFSLSAEVKKYDPMLALDGGMDGLDAYRDIIANLKKHLNKGGIFCFEIGHHQSDDVSQILEENGFKHFQTIKDYGQMDRCIIGEMTI